MSGKPKINAKIRWVPRHGTLEEWEKSNPVLLAGEIGVVIGDSESQYQKIGDGVRRWKDLPWKSGPQGIQGEKGDKGDKGENNPEYTEYDILRKECEEAAKKAVSAADDAEQAANAAATVRKEVAAGGFIESLKEQNDGEKFTVWVGTQAEYEAIEVKDNNCLYIIEDDAPFAVDKSYNNESENAQSGKAVAEAVGAVETSLNKKIAEEIQKCKNMIGYGENEPTKDLTCLFYVQCEE